MLDWVIRQFDGKLQEYDSIIQNAFSHFHTEVWWQTVLKLIAWNQLLQKSSLELLSLSYTSRPSFVVSDTTTVINLSATAINDCTRIKCLHDVVCSSFFVGNSPTIACIYRVQKTVTLRQQKEWQNTNNRIWPIYYSIFTDFVSTQNRRFRTKHDHVGFLVRYHREYIPCLISCRTKLPTSESCATHKPKLT